MPTNPVKELPYSFLRSMAVFDKWCKTGVNGRGEVKTEKKTGKIR
jgi:hypothetical protein